MRRTDLSDRAMRWILATLCVLITVAIAVLGILIVTTINGSTTQATQRATQAAINRLHDEAILTCRRQNITRSTDNAAHLESYQLYQFLLRSTRASKVKIPPVEQRAIQRLQNGQTAATWTPLIDCTAAHEAVKALSLQPIPFSRRLPPASALDPSNAVRPDPKGSVS